MTYRAVIADDDATMRRLVRRLIERDGRFLIVGEAANGREALDQIAALDPDVLLLDLTMPGMDGFEVLEHLDTYTTPVLVLTGHADHDIHRAAIRLGASGCLVKGRDFAELPDRLARAAERVDPTRASDPADPAEPDAPALPGAPPATGRAG